MTAALKSGESKITLMLMAELFITRLNELVRFFPITFQQVENHFEPPCSNPHYIGLSDFPTVVYLFFLPIFKNL